MKTKLSEIDQAFMYLSRLAAERKDFVLKVGLDLFKDEEYLELNKVLVVLNRISRKNNLKDK